MSEVMIYKQGKGWRVALNPKTDCQIYLVATKKRATELANELLLKTEVICGDCLIPLSTCQHAKEYKR